MIDLSRWPNLAEPIAFHLTAPQASLLTRGLGRWTERAESLRNLRDAITNAPDGATVTLTVTRHEAIWIAYAVRAWSQGIPWTERAAAAALWHHLRAFLRPPGWGDRP